MSVTNAEALKNKTAGTLLQANRVKSLPPRKTPVQPFVEQSEKVQQEVQQKVEQEKNPAIEPSLSPNVIKNVSENVGEMEEQKKENKKVVAPKPATDILFEDEYKRASFYVRKEYLKELAKRSKSVKGMKTHIVNQALKLFLEQALNNNVIENVSKNVGTRVQDETESATFFIDKKILSSLDEVAKKIGGKGAKSRTIINAALHDYFQKG